MEGSEDACLCCNTEFVAFEKKLSCAKCGNSICGKCVREVEEKENSTENGHGGRITICKDCEFMGKWVNDVKSKDKGKFWNLKMPRGLFKRKASNNKMPSNLNSKFSMVSNMVEKSNTRGGGGGGGGGVRSRAVTVPENIQQDLHALSREKIKELIDQKKLISELQAENERMRNGAVDPVQLQEMKRMIDELKRESEAHISELQHQVDDLSAENTRLRNGGGGASSVAPTSAYVAPAVQEDPKFAKYRKMQKAGLPEGAIMQAAARDGVDLAADFFTAPPPAAAPAAAPVVQEDPKFAKYRKMQKAGLPEGAIMQAASRDGVDLPADFFTGPAPAPAAAPIVQEDPKFAKYRKMQKAGLPEGAIMQAASRDGIELPSDFFTGPVPAAAPAPVIQEDPKFAKYRKMQKAGLPEGAIMQAASRDGIELPGDFFTGPVPAAAAPVIEEDPKFAKYRKMQKAGLPDGAIMQAASRDGVELPSTFFSGPAPTPPPLPGAPSPPPLPGSAAAKPKEPEKPKSKYEITKRADVRRGNSKPLRGIFWNVLPAARVEKSMWPKLSDQPPFPIDQHFADLEDKFSKVQAKEIKNTAAKAAAKTSDRPPLLDSKRQQNLGIAIARFKEPVGELRDNILKLDSDFFTMEVVHKLISMVPTPEEVQAVQAAEGEWSGPGLFTDDLTRVEHFVYEMSKIPRLRQRLQCVFVEMSFERQSESLLEALTKYETAILQLRDSKGWRQLLHLALSAGNYVNTGNKSTGGAWGFEISTGLQKLAQSKANGNSKYSLVHWLADVCDSKAPHLFQLPDELSRVEEASSVKIEDLKTDLAQLAKGCDLVERELKACSGDTLGEPSQAPGARAFCKLMFPFLKDQGRPVTEQMKASMARLENLANEVLEMHGELPAKCSSSQLLATAMHFCKSLVRAREENVQNRAIEEQKEKENMKKSSAPKPPKGKKNTKSRAEEEKADEKPEFQQRLQRLKHSQQRPASLAVKNNPDSVQSA